ncbi:MAG: DUF2071 domain-containing protein, partial [Actinobacteria bacterium]|nr:DUF2071 domain-containing protein [Actinomycetota bacterium]
LRTYVTDGEHPGIWFFSIRITNRLVVEAMKRFYRLPAEYAHVAVDAERVRADGLEARYENVGDPFEAKVGTFEHFAIERYRQYTADGGRIYFADVHHRPWQLRRAEGVVSSFDAAPVGVEGAPRLHHASRQDALVWPLEEL